MASKLVNSEYVSPRKSSQKKEPEVKIVEKYKKYLCACCGTETNSLNKFTKGKSKMYKAWDYNFPVCTECLDSMFDTYALKYGTRYKALHRMCQMTDSYFDPTLFDTIEKETDGGKTAAFFRTYLAKLNLRQYKNKTYDTYLDEKELEDSKKKLEEELAKEKHKAGSGDDSNIFVITSAMVRRWGTGGFVEDDYKTLEDHYHMLKDNNPNADGNQEVFIKDLCKLHLLMTNALKASDTDRYIKSSDQYSKIFTKAGLKTVEEKDSSADETLGVTLATISRFTPEEYYKDKKRYRDFDGIGEYFERFVLRPLKNLQFGTSERDKEFKVKEEE